MYSSHPQMANHSSPSSLTSWDELHKPTYYFAGTCLFSLSNLCAQPFILLKRRQQMGLAPLTASGGGGTFRLLYDIAKVEGYSGLFRSSSIAWVPGGARMLYFTVYEHVADFLGSNASHHHWIRHDVTSSTPASVIVNVPADSHTTTTTAMTHYPGWVHGAAGGISTFASQLIMAPYSVIQVDYKLPPDPAIVYRQ